LTGLLFWALPAVAAKRPEVLVVTDLLVADAAFASPTAAEPCPYVMLPGRSLALGQSWAGERLPERAEVENLLQTALSSQHYVLTQPGGPRPQLALIYFWGEANLELDEQEEVDNATGETSTSAVAFNTGTFSRLIGLDRLKERKLTLAEELRFDAVLREDRLYLLIAAVDASALAAGRHQLIWRTWISIPSLRHSLARDLAGMMDQAAPFFGRDTPVPAFLDPTLGRAEVEVGEAQVVESSPE
jgi:hypothetical protein